MVQILPPDPRPLNPTAEVPRAVDYGKPHKKDRIPDASGDVDTTGSISDLWMR